MTDCREASRSAEKKVSASDRASGKTSPSSGTVSARASICPKRYGRSIRRISSRGAQSTASPIGMPCSALKNSPSAGPDDAPTVTPQAVGNPDLKPERGEEIELGFEAGLFDRVGIDFTVYNKQTKDAILLRSTPPSGGFPGQQYVNIGQISNKRIELQVNPTAFAAHHGG